MKPFSYRLGNSGNVICFSTKTWNSLWTRKQRFMKMLAESGHKVLYVEPVPTIKTILIRLREKSIHKLCSRLFEVNSNLHIFTPPVLIPGKSRFYSVSRIDQLILGFMVKRIQKKLRFFDPILWIFGFNASNMIGAFSEKLVVFEYTDKLSEFKGVNKYVAKRLTIETAQKADIIFVTADGLFKEMKEINKNTFISSNGTDARLFSKALNNHISVPEKMRGIRHPILGFAGAISDWVDLDLIKYTAEQLPEYSIVLIGPISKKSLLSWRRKYKNIFHIDKVRQDVLPMFLANFDVCLNTLKLNSLTETLNPLKIYDYLAAGKPIVSTNIPEVRKIEKYIYISRSYEEFVALTKKALKEDSEKRRLARMKCANKYSWERIFKAQVEVILPYLET